MEHLPVPDMEASWQKMHSILDAEMPLADKKKPAIGKWWISGIAVLLLIGTVVFYNHSVNMRNDKPSVEMVESSTTFPESVKTDKNIANIEGNTNTETRKTANMTMPGAREEQVLVTTNPASSEKIADNETIVHKNKISGFEGNKRKDVTLQSSGLPIVQAQSKTEQVFEKNKSKVLGPNAAVSSLHIPASKGKAIPEDKTSFKYSTSATVFLNTPASVPVENLLYTDTKPIHNFGKPGKATYTLPPNESSQKAALKQMKRQQRKDERDMAKSYRTSRSFWGEQPDRWFAAGIAPFQSVALGNQKTYNYGAGATRNMVTDYIPSPYLQLHLTNRVYVQSEFQFNAPQSTPALLLDQRTLVTPAIAALQQNTFLRKLYYFHMPVSFYYSPVKNFYFGSGLQFSSLSSGLATVEQNAPNNTQMNSETITLKDDALSTRFRGSEWRYLLDANYNINRFAFGVRYSQALNNYIDEKAVNNLPAIQARNQAFQVYMRYNIIVSDKRR